MKLLHDLRRRRMFRLAGLYIVGAWVVIQVAEALFAAWGIPETANRYVFIAAAMCFPIAFAFGWIYDITSEGIVRTKPAGASETVDLSLKRTDFVILAGLFAVGIAVLIGSAGQIIDDVDESIGALERYEYSIAVLPFSNLDTNSDTGFFSDGVTEEILHRLSGLQSLSVLGRTSSFAFRNSTDGPARIAEILGVRYLLQGSVRRDQNFVRVTASLVDESGLQVWSQTFDRELEGIFSIQSEIASTVAGQILNEIVPLEALPAGRTTDNLDAYNAYLIGREFFNRRPPGWQDDAAASFRRAIELDPNFAPAHAGLAITAFIGVFADDFGESIASVERALELDPNLPEALAIHGLLLHELGSSERAIAQLRRAIELDPSFVHAYNWLAIVLGETDRTEEARDARQRGLAVDPLNPPLVVNVAKMFSVDGDPETAREIISRLTYLPEIPGLAYWELISLETNFGRHDEAALWAIENIRAYAPTGNRFVFAVLGYIYQRLGMDDSAAYWIELFNKHEPNPLQRAMRNGYWYRQRGEFDKMLESSTSGGVPPERAWPSLTAFQAGALMAMHSTGGEYEMAIRIYEARGKPDLDAIIHEMNTETAMEFLHSIAIAYQRTGQHEEASVILENIRRAFESETELGNRFPPVISRLAHNHALAGNSDESIATLQRAVDMGWTDHSWITTDPSWGETADRPEFQALIARMKVEIDRQRAHIESVHDEQAFRAEVDSILSNLD